MCILNNFKALETKLGIKKQLKMSHMNTVFRKNYSRKSDILVQEFNL